MSLLFVVDLVEKLKRAQIVVKSIISTPGMFPGVSFNISPDHMSTFSITTAWCKEHGVPIEKLFSKALLTKCTFLAGTSFSIVLLIDSRLL